MGETLDETVLLLCNRAVENAHLPIVAPCKHVVRNAGVKVHCSDVVVILGILPLSVGSLSQVPIYGVSIEVQEVCDKRRL